MQPFKIFEKKHKLIMCLYNPANVRVEQLFDVLKGLPVVFVACDSVKSVDFVETLMEVKKV